MNWLQRMEIAYNRGSYNYKFGKYLMTSTTLAGEKKKTSPIFQQCNPMNRGDTLGSTTHVSAVTKLIGHQSIQFNEFGRVRKPENTNNKKCDAIECFLALPHET